MQIVRKYGLSKQEDLVTATTAINSAYRLGDEVEVYDDANSQVKKFVYVGAATTTLTAYRPYTIQNVSTTGYEVTAAVATTSLLVSAMAKVGVPQVTITSGYYGFVQTEGQCTQLSTATTGMAAGWVGKLLAGTTACVSTTGILQTINAYCVCTGTATTTASGTFNLFGYRVEVSS